MVMSIIVQLAILSLIDVQETTGHGALIEPPMRSVLWKYGFDAPINYNYTELYCGGYQNYLNNGGRCGVCGDPLQGPYENEKGGKYDLGIISRSYPKGSTNIEVRVEMTAHHRGYFEFKLCPNNEAEITQDCLDRYPLMIEEGIQQGDPLKFYPTDGEVFHSLKVFIPPDMRCERCAIQWTYKTGNRWGKDPDGKSCLGCGMQEQFINCADISIGSPGTVVNTRLRSDVNTRLKSVANLAVSDQTPNIADQKHGIKKIQTENLGLKGIAPNTTTPSTMDVARKQISKDIVRHHEATTDSRQTDFRPDTPQKDITRNTNEAFTKTHIPLFREQRISTTTSTQINANNNSHIQELILNATAWINKVSNFDRQGQPMGRHQPPPGILNKNAHLFPLNQLHIVNRVQGGTMGRNQPQNIRSQVQAIFAHVSPQVQDFYPVLLNILSNYQQNTNLQFA